MCLYYIFNFNFMCLERCFKEVNFIIIGDCEENCFFVEKICYKECFELYNYYLNILFFIWCLKKCLIYIYVNNFICELLCRNNELYLYNNICRRICLDSYRFVYFYLLKFNEILMCINYCVNLVLY